VAKLKIDTVWVTEPGRWDDAWTACRWATYYHSREWAELWCRYTEDWYHPSPAVATFSDGRQALLPLSSEKRESESRGYVSSPPDTYGGWIAAEPLARSHAELLTEFLTTKLGKLDWQLNPFDPLVADLGIQADEPDETHILDLSIGFDSIYGHFSSACRRAERKARRSGVSVRLARTKADWQEYYRAYEDSYRRWGSQALSKYEWHLFELMYELRSDDLRLWLAMNDEGRIIAGAVMGYASNHAAYWHGAALEEYLPLRPTNLLFTEIIKDASRRGLKWFDFNSSAGLDGVRRFKESFGAKPLDCLIVHVPAP